VGAKGVGGKSREKDQCKRFQKKSACQARARLSGAKGRKQKKGRKKALRDVKENLPTARWGKEGLGVAQKVWGDESRSMKCGRRFLHNPASFKGSSRGRGVLRAAEVDDETLTGPSVCKSSLPWGA